MRGNARIGKGDYDRAIADFDQALRLGPKDASTSAGRGAARYGKKDLDGAIADYDEAIRLDPKYADAYNGRGAVREALRDRDGAIADYDEAIRLDPSDPRTFANRGATRHARKEYDLALADYAASLRLDPDHPAALNNLAWLRATCPDPRYRDGRLAVESAARASDLARRKEPTRLGALAAAFAESGDFAKAVEWQGLANGLYPDPEDRRKGEARLKLYADKKPYRDEQAP